MSESGIDIGCDLSSLLTEDVDIESAIDFEDLLGTPKNQDFYELTSKTLPVSERWEKKTAKGIKFFTNFYLLTKSHTCALYKKDQIEESENLERFRNKHRISFS